MTLDEATTIAAIASTADGGCSVCVGDLAGQLNDAFPEWRWSYRDPHGPVDVVPGTQNAARHCPDEGLVAGVSVSELAQITAQEATQR